VHIFYHTLLFSSSTNLFHLQQDGTLSPYFCAKFTKIKVNIYDYYALKTNGV